MSEKNKEKWLGMRIEKMFKRKKEENVEKKRKK